MLSREVQESKSNSIPATKNPDIPKLSENPKKTKLVFLSIRCYSNIELDIKLTVVKLIFIMKV